MPGWSAAANRTNIKCAGNIISTKGKERTIERSQRVNEQIRISPVRVIGADGQQLGVMPTEQALAAAREVELDLVEVAPEAKPPVCRIMDFGKFKYQQQKRKHKAHQVKIKEIRVRPKTDEHDLGTKVNHAREFLAAKNKVLVSIVFRGRELAHIEEGQRIVQQIIRNLDDVAKVETPPNQQGKRITCVLSPR